MDELKITSINPAGNYQIMGNVLLQMLDKVATLAVEKYIAMNTPQEDRLLTTDETMKLLGIKSRATLDRYQNQKGNKLKYIPGSPKRFYESDIKAFLLKNKVG